MTGQAGRISRRRSAAIACAAALLAHASWPAAVHAQTYPERQIRLVVPSPPGGGTDTLSRLVAAKLAEAQSWQILIDNRPGGGGNIGMDIVAKSPPDGYTIALGESSNLTINPYLYSTLAFDAAKDLTPVVLVGTVPLVLVTAPAGRFDSVDGIVSAAKAKPLTFASGGNGTVGHLAGEIWMRRAGISLVHVPYRGGAPAITDVIGGQVDLNFASVPAAASMIGSGKLRALAVTSSRRTVQLPDVPTLEELGYPGFSAQVMYGFVAPAGTPTAIVARLNKEMNAALRAPDVSERLAKIGVDIRGGTPEDFAAFLAAERAKWQRAVADSGARVD